MDNLTTITVQVTPDQLINIAKILGGQSPQAKAKRQTRDKIGTKPTKTKTNAPKTESKPESKPDQLPEHLMEHIISPDAYESPKPPTRKVVAADGNEYDIPLNASVSADGELYVTGKLTEAPLPEYPQMTFEVMDDYFPVDAPRDPVVLRKFLAEKAEHLEMTMDEMAEDMLQ